MVIKSPEDFHNKLGFAFHALLALPLAAFVYLFLEIRHRNLQPAIDNNNQIFIFKIVLPIIALCAIAAGYYFRKNDQQRVNQQRTLSDKLTIYYEESVKFYALMAIAATVLVLGLWLTASTVFIIAYVLLLFLMSLNRPTIQKYVKNIKLTKEEREIILKKKSFSGSDPTTPEES